MAEETKPQEQTQQPTQETPPTEAPGAADPGPSTQGVEHIKHFSPLSLIAAGLTVLFVIFLFIEGLCTRWWLMLPMAAVALYLFYIQKDHVEGLEKTVCTAGFWIMIIGVIWRDIYVSSLAVSALGAAAALPAG